MAIEIERKFLVRGSGWNNGEPTLIRQGYLNSDKSRTVRVRTAGSQAYLTIKGLTTGASRKEFEYEVPLAEAEELLELCEPPLIEKRRYVDRRDGVKWEIDEYLGANEGLVVAEVELESEQQHLELPAWAGEEVTDDPRYFNSRLSKQPYTEWQ